MGVQRTVEVATRDTRLSIRHHRLRVERDGEMLGDIPIEDLGLLVLDADGVRLTSGVLRAIASQGGAVLTCDEQHLPSGLLLPLAANGLHVARLRHQVSCSEPLRKNLWARLVRAKVTNQAELLWDVDARRKLHSLAGNVRSGDPKNVEAQAARVYWDKVFSKALLLGDSAFRRSHSGARPNPFLNYGYSVLRAATARALCGAGLHPGLGLHHHNRESGYALADDVMEAYRPWVDAAVIELVTEGRSDLGREERARLLSVLVDTVSMAGGSGPLQHALSRSAASLAEALALGSRKLPAVAAARAMELPSWPRKAA